MYYDIICLIQKGNIISKRIFTIPYATCSNHLAAIATQVSTPLYLCDIEVRNFLDAVKKIHFGVYFDVLFLY